MVNLTLKLGETSMFCTVITRYIQLFVDNSRKVESPNKCQEGKDVVFITCLRIMHGLVLLAPCLYCCLLG